MKSIDLSGITPTYSDDEFVNPYMALKPYEGQILKYRELCDIVGDEYKSGRSLTLQTQKWGKYVDIDKQSKGRYLVHYVYSNEAELGILKSYGKYTRYIEQFLMDKFYAIRLNDDSDRIVLTNRDILEETSMVNYNYFRGRRDPLPYVQHFTTGFKRADMPNEYFENDYLVETSNLFFAGSYRLLKRIISDSLKILEKKALIIPNKTFRLYKNEWVDYDGLKVISSNHHDCDDDEVARVLKVQHDSIEEFNLKVPRDKYGNPKYYIRSITGLHYLYKEQREEYNKIFKRRLEQEFSEDGWNACSIAWDIHLAKRESIEYEIKERQNYMALNRQVQNKLLTSKELDVITKALREQFVEEFIKK